MVVGKPRKWKVRLPFFTCRLGFLSRWPPSCTRRVKLTLTCHFACLEKVGEVPPFNTSFYRGAAPPLSAAADKLSALVVLVGAAVLPAVCHPHLDPGQGTTGPLFHPPRGTSQSQNAHQNVAFAYQNERIENYRTPHTFKIPPKSLRLQRCPLINSQHHPHQSLLQGMNRPLPLRILTHHWSHQ